jgi:hypothetical protein
VSMLSRAVAGLLTTAIVVALAPAAIADDVYHSEQMRLAPVGSAPLRSGFVENIHADGPTVYAQEAYVLNHAIPDADYEVHLLAYPFDPTCGGTAVDFGFTTLSTNGAGNGRAKRVIRPADVPVNSAAPRTGSAGRSVSAGPQRMRRLVPPSRSIDAYTPAGDARCRKISPRQGRSSPGVADGCCLRRNQRCRAFLRGAVAAVSVQEL